MFSTRGLGHGSVAGVERSAWVDMVARVANVARAAMVANPRHKPQRSHPWKVGMGKQQAEKCCLGAFRGLPPLG